jgi:hypothetical protein
MIFLMRAKDIFYCSIQQLYRPKAVDSRKAVLLRLNSSTAGDGQRLEIYNLDAPSQLKNHLANPSLPAL